MNEVGEGVPVAEATAPAQILEKVYALADQTTKDDLRDVSKKQELANKAAGILRKSGITSLNRGKIQEVYALARLDLGIARHRGEASLQKKLDSAAGRRFVIVDLGVEGVDFNATEWRGDINNAVSDELGGIYKDIRDAVLKEKGLDVNFESEIPPEVQEEIKKRTDEEYRRLREKIAQDPRPFVKKALAE